MLENLVIKYAADNEVVYDPATLVSSITKNFVIQNLGEEDITGLGAYVVPATNIGDVDHPAEYPPETDYQDLIRWGEETQQGVVGAGGLILTLPQNSGPDNTSYVTRQAGSTRANKLSMADLPAGSSYMITLEIETPAAVVARRLYISLRFDISV